MSEADPTNTKALQWLEGNWEGSGVYFGTEAQPQDVICRFTIQGRSNNNFLYSHQIVALNESGKVGGILEEEVGYFFLASRNNVHSLKISTWGIAALWMGIMEILSMGSSLEITQARIRFVTDQIIRKPDGINICAGDRMLALLDGKLLWVSDYAYGDGTMGDSKLKTHGSAEMTKI